MNSWRSSLLLSILVVCLCSSPAFGLYCAQCNHRVAGCRSGNVRPTPCPRASSHCFVFYLMLGPRGYGTFRGCKNQVTDAPQCRSVTVNGETGIGCTEVCDFDGCNSELQIVRHGKRR